MVQLTAEITSPAGRTVSKYLALDPYLFTVIANGMSNRQDIADWLKKLKSAYIRMSKTDVVKRNAERGKTPVKCSRCNVDTPGFFEAHFKKTPLCAECQTSLARWWGDPVPTEQIKL